MSKIGKLPIEIPDGVTVAVAGDQVQITSSNGNTSYTLADGINATVADGKIQLDAPNKNDRKVRAMYGLSRANLANVITGITKGFEKKLELIGVGYRAQMQGADLVLSLGFAHPVKFGPREGIKMVVADNKITISGSDKVLVGEIAAEIRAVKPPEPYKGKGIKYQGEHVRRKAGKAAKAAGAK